MRVGLTCTITLKDDGEGSRRNIFNQGKKLKDTRYTFHKYYTLKELFKDDGEGSR
jgi:hypothetical protein